MFEVSATYMKTEVMSIDVDDPRLAATMFRDQHGRLPDAVESEAGLWAVYGACESCDAVIFEGEAFYRWSGEESVSTCRACGGGDETHEPEVYTAADGFQLATRTGDSTDG